MKKYKYITRTFTLPSGTRKYIYGRTKAEADAKLAEAKAQVAAGVKVDDDTTFAELANLWLDQYKAPYIKASTLRQLRSNVQSHLIANLGKYKVRSVTPLMCQQLISRLASQQLSTTGVTLAHLRSIFDVGVELGLIVKSPVSASLQAPQQHRKKGEVKVMPKQTDAEVLKHLTAFSPEHIFFMLAKETGGRRNEIFALRWDCVDLDKGVIHFRRNLVQREDGSLTLTDYMKTEQGKRSVPISGALREVLTVCAAWQGEDGFLLRTDDGSPMTSAKIATVLRRLTKAVRAADPAYGENFTAHSLRHSYITRLIEAGCDVKEVQRLAGHKDVQTTLGTYTHYNEEARQDETFAKVRDYLRA